MVFRVAVIFSVLLSVSWCRDDLDFPPRFRFGAATSSYQMEGAWNISDKGENIWDRYVHTKSKTIRGGTNGDVACDSYHQWKRDVEMVAELGLHFYRFSMSWSRLLPTGLTDYISEDGVSYYNNLIDELLKRDIEPMVTIYHFDLPQRLQDLGGWINPLISDWFVDYARVLFSLYGDRVKTWITINEPVIVCDFSYNRADFAPSTQDPYFANYLCTKNLLIAHAKVYRMYEKDFKDLYAGEVSIANQLFWFEPETPEDEELAELMRYYSIGMYYHPIFSKEGGWPPMIAKLIAENSKKRGLLRSRLPEFTQEEIDLVKGSADFLAVNHYTSRYIRKANPAEVVPHWPMDGSPELDAVLNSKTEFNGWLWVYPVGIRKLLSWLKKEYGNVCVMITENGYHVENDTLDDYERIKNIVDYLKQVLLAIKEDGVNVTGYTVWALMDNFEWLQGYDKKFGLYHVNFEDPERKRTPKRSAHFYASVIKNHSLDVLNQKQ